MPCAANACALLQDDEVAAVVPFDQVDRCAHAGDASSDDDNGGIGMVLVADGLRELLAGCSSSDGQTWLTTSGHGRSPAMAVHDKVASECVEL